MRKKTKLWIKAAMVRALKTFAQTMLATTTVSTLIQDVSWESLVSISLLSSFNSILTSIAGLPEVKEDE